VVAAEPGPAANVPAGAIDTVVNESIDAQLQGFAENAQRRVTNPAATVGGIDASGVEVTEEDVDAAVAILVGDLEAQVADALPDDGLVVMPDAAAEPVVDGIAELAGTRDPERIEIEGSLGWEAYRVDEAAVVEAARDRLTAAVDLLPDGHELLPDSVEVNVGPATVTGDRVTVDTTVAAESAPILDPAELRREVAGRSAESAAAALDGIGPVAVELWPPWVDTVPTLDWRIDVRVTEETAGAGPVPSDGSEGPRASDDGS
jgi:hypothetical protein